MNFGSVALFLLSSVAFGVRVDVKNAATLKDTGEDQGAADTDETGVRCCGHLQSTGRYCTCDYAHEYFNKQFCAKTTSTMEKKRNLEHEKCISCTAAQIEKTCKAVNNPVVPENPTLKICAEMYTSILKYTPYKTLADKACSSAGDFMREISRRSRTFTKGKIELEKNTRLDENDRAFLEKYKWENCYSTMDNWIAMTCDTYYPVCSDAPATAEMEAAKKAVAAQKEAAAAKLAEVETEGKSAAAQAAAATTDAEKEAAAAAVEKAATDKAAAVKAVAAASSIRPGADVWQEDNLNCGNVLPSLADAEMMPRDSGSAS